jgi:mycofactocin system FadH/OYE family oxidoreductase 2
MFNNLFSPLRLGQVETMNRIWFLGHRTNFGKMGMLTDRHIAYYRRRAQGGCGVIVVGELSIHPDDRPRESMIEAYHPEIVKRYRELTASVHEFGTAVLAQLNHHGYQSSGEITRKPILGPSALADIVHGETAKEMEPEDFELVKNAFAEAAVLAREGGFDGIELDMGHEALLRQFLSPLSNLRRDEYGGTFENRMRFPLEVIDEVSRRVGKDFLLGIRLCADEMFWGAINIEESRKFAQVFESTGDVDFINTTLGSHYNHLYLILASMHTPRGFTVELSRQLKEVVSIPVITGYQIMSPDMAEEILAAKKADAIGFARPLICDPDFPRKALGSPDKIRFCIMDNDGCIGRLNRNKTLGCCQNPEVGHEPLEGEGGYVPALAKKKVIVVGAGPGGLEAARVARLRGHDVLVYELESDLGGQVNLIKKRPLRSPIRQLINHLVYAIHDLGITPVRGEGITADKIVALEPDAVIVATGARPIDKPVSGDYGPPGVLNVRELLTGDYEIGPRVLFIDEHGGHYATATAEMLLDQGMNLELVTSDLFVGIELAAIGDLYLSRQRLLQKGARFTTDVMIDSIEGKTVIGRDIYTNKEIRLEGFDTIVLAMGRVANDELYKELKGRVKELYRAGDCVAPRSIELAIREGRKTGEMV